MPLTRERLLELRDGTIGDPDAPTLVDEIASMAKELIERRDQNCLHCGYIPTDETCTGCEGMGRWRARAGSTLIRCGKCIGTGRKDLSGPSRIIYVMDDRKSEPCEGCGKEIRADARDE